MDLLMAIDMGTTHIKVATFDLEGNLHTVEMSRTNTKSLGVGQAVYDPEEIWDSVVELLRKTAAQLGPGQRVLSISVASMGEAGLLLDEQDRPLTPIISWFDVRGKEVMEGWYEKISPEECFAITGLNYNYIYSLFKLLWYKQNQPEIFRQAVKWLCMPDYIYFRLTGEFATDYSIASRTMLFDIRQRKWSERLLQLAELDEELLPPAYQGGTVIGQVRREVCELTGLPGKILVAVGGHDHICGTLAANVIRPGKVMNSSGTAETLNAVFRDLPPLSIETFSGFNVGCHVVPELYYLQGEVVSSGISIEWFLDQFCRADDGTRMSYGEMVRLAETAPPGAQGLFFIPHLRGGSPPDPAPYSKACFLGMRDYHTRADFLRSIHEGLCCEVAGILQSMEAVLGLEFQAIHAIGGGTKNELWMEIKSAATGKPLEIPQVQESTLLGAALLGGVGAGVYADHYAAAELTYGPSRIYHPEAGLVEQYHQIGAVYAQLLPRAREISRIIGED
ncbi:MAG: FGGY-family carbohydrate kinase [Limnochordia bacterium]|jgi:xylulokinase|nr:FGGY family carbohydrate kinase [Bacillota bacterium]HBG09033.1 hypothetical protein [Bacillota bacterium]